jgi:histidinol-phosphate/aromatic aminotransferase/cobyric acid decarboxylase-like protein
MKQPCTARPIAAVLSRHPDVWIMADGLYEQIVFDADCALTLAEVAPSLKQRTLTVGGIAKTYAMMGWRIGYAAGPSALIREMIKIQSQTTSCASSISQAAAIAALDGPQDLLRERISILREKRDRFVALVNDCAGLSCAAPEATFYLLDVQRRDRQTRSRWHGNQKRPRFCGLFAAKRRSGGFSGRRLRGVAGDPCQLCQSARPHRGSGPKTEERLRDAAVSRTRRNRP